MNKIRFAVNFIIKIQKLKEQKINFLGIGAQKSGTSWLYRQFEKSNQIQLPPIKELHYFDRSKKYPSPNFLTQTRLLSRIVNPKWTIQALQKTFNDKKDRQWYKNWFFSDYTDEWYLSLFKDYYKCKGEITPAYAILEEKDVAKMSELLGNETKIIFLLRNPIERSWSSYKYKFKVNDFKEENIHHAKKYFLTDEHLLRSQYSKTIQLYNKYFDTVCVGFFDAIVDDPKKLLQDIFQYLKLDNSEINQFSGLHKRVNLSKTIKIPKSLESILKEMHSSEISELALSYGGYFKKWENPELFQKLNTNQLKPTIII